jgi:predicted secreted protein
MATEAFVGLGAELHRWNGSQWDTIAEITSIKGPGKKRDTVEVTSLDSIEGYKEIIGGLRDGGTVTLSMNFRRAMFDLFNEDFESDELQNYEIVLPDTDITTFEFTGLVTELPLSVTTKDAVSADVTIQISGKVVVNSGVNSGSPS